MTTAAAVTRPSARARARRPHLVPRDPAPSTPDPDVTAVAERTGDLLEPLPDPPPMTLVSGETILPPAPASPAPVSQPIAPVVLRSCTYEDVDRLWDWCREDVTGAKRFLGKMPPHSHELQTVISGILASEAQGTALLRAIDLQGDGVVHAGFVMLNPIHRATNVAMAHCYLAPMIQGELPRLLPTLLDYAAELEPDLTLMISTSDYAFAKLLQPHGFTLQIALTRPPVSQGTGRGR